jgi:hypothetical protein
MRRREAQSKVARVRHVLQVSLGAAMGRRRTSLVCFSDALDDAMATRVPNHVVRAPPTTHRVSTPDCCLRRSPRQQRATIRSTDKRLEGREVDQARVAERLAVQPWWPKEARGVELLAERDAALNATKHVEPEQGEADRPRSFSDKRHVHCAQIQAGFDIPPKGQRPRR